METAEERVYVTTTEEAATDQPSSARDKAKQVSSTAAEQGKEVASTAAERGKEVAQEAREQAVEVARRAGEQVRSVATEAREQLRQQAESRTAKAADSIRTLGGQLRALSEGRTEDAGPARDYIGRVAEQMDTLASRIDERGYRGLLSDAADFARRKPGTFLAAALAGGFLAGRFAKSAGGGETDGEVYEDEVSAIDLTGAEALPAESIAPDLSTEAAPADVEPVFADVSVAEEPTMDVPATGVTAEVPAEPGALGTDADVSATDERGPLLDQEDPTDPTRRL